MAGGNRSRSVGISILYARPGGSSHLAGLTAHSATRQPKALLSCDKIKRYGPTGRDCRGFDALDLASKDGMV